MSNVHCARERIPRLPVEGKPANSVAGQSIDPPILKSFPNRIPVIACRPQAHDAMTIASWMPAVMIRVPGKTENVAPLQTILNGTSQSEPPMEWRKEQCFSLDSEQPCIETISTNGLHFGLKVSQLIPRVLCDSQCGGQRPEPRFLFSTKH